MQTETEITAEIQKIEKELSGELKRSDAVYTTMGDGWHENAAWEFLQNRVKVLSKRVVLLKELLAEKRQAGKTL